MDEETKQKKAEDDTTEDSDEGVQPPADTQPDNDNKES